MKQFMITLIVLILVSLGSACDNTDCSKENHCRKVDGVAQCFDGFFWEDPDAGDNFRCITVCSPEVHCHMESGSPACDFGYKWIDPTDNDNLICILGDPIACVTADQCPTGLGCPVWDVEPMCGECTAWVECRQGQACIDGSCTGCSTSFDCMGALCNDGLCVPCTSPADDGRCQEDYGRSTYACQDDGRCIPDYGPGPGPQPECPDLPPLECEGTASYCGEVVPFEPVDGDGYENYPCNGETSTNQYRSYLRRDLMMLVKYASAKVACKALGWPYGNGGPSGLGDMSEANGDIPGTSIGQPGHPEGTHTDGHDIDIGYYQVGTDDNRMRVICDHYDAGGEAYHCTEIPDSLDQWRTALFLAAMAEHPSLRVVGVDGKAGPMIDDALDELCQDGWIEPSVCGDVPMTYEETNLDYGWYYFHHHHFHVSFSSPSYYSSTEQSVEEIPCLIPGCDALSLEAFYAERLTRR